MKNNKGVTLTSLIITIIVLIIISAITSNIGKEVIQEAKLQDLRTNMLLIQAKVKIYAEEVTFQTANLDSNKEEDLAKITEIKVSKYKGTPLERCNTIIQTAAQNAGITVTTDFYYLSSENLSEMGINLKEQKDAYYLVKYDISNTEVVFTKGIKYKEKTYYKLSEINQIEQ
jgi:Tfp pilus assembly protein PilE